MKGQLSLTGTINFFVFCDSIFPQNAKTFNAFYKNKLWPREISHSTLTVS